MAWIMRVIYVNTYICKYASKVNLRKLLYTHKYIPLVLMLNIYTEMIINNMHLCTS